MGLLRFFLKPGNDSFGINGNVAVLLDGFTVANVVGGNGYVGVPRVLQSSSLVDPSLTILNLNSGWRS